MMRVAAALLSTLLISGCGGGEPRARQFSFFAFGTLVELTVAGTDEATARRARELSVQHLEQWHRDWHAWEPGPLVDLNHDLAAGRAVTIPDALAGLIPRARELSAASGGRFDPAIGRLISLWDFHSDTSPGGPPPPDADIKALVGRDAGMEDLAIIDGKVSTDNGAVQLDFGAFAKGVALSRLSDAIREAGVRNFLLNAGGDLVAWGHKEDRPWRIGIREPRGTGVLAGLEPRDGEAVFTSGDYERYYLWNGTRYHHIIDPRTGYPARDVRSVTVVHDDPALADAAATALFVAGPGNFAAVARDMGVDKVMLVDDEGAIHMTSAMQERVRIRAQPHPTIHVQ